MKCSHSLQVLIAALTAFSGCNRVTTSVDDSAALTAPSTTPSAISSVAHGFLADSATPSPSQNSCPSGYTFNSDSFECTSETYGQICGRPDALIGVDSFAADKKAHPYFGVTAGMESGWSQVCVSEGQSGSRPTFVNYVVYYVGSQTEANALVSHIGNEVIGASCSAIQNAQGGSWQVNCDVQSWAVGSLTSYDNQPLPASLDFDGLDVFSFPRANRGIPLTIAGVQNMQSQGDFSIDRLNDILTAAAQYTGGPVGSAVSGSITIATVRPDASNFGASVTDSHGRSGGVVANFQYANTSAYVQGPHGGSCQCNFNYKGDYFNGTFENSCFGDCSK